MSVGTTVQHKNAHLRERSLLHFQAFKVQGVFEELWVMAGAVWHGVSASYFRVRGWDKVLKVEQGEECWAVLVCLDAQWMSSPLPGLILWVHLLNDLPCNSLSFSLSDPDLCKCSLSLSLSFFFSLSPCVPHSGLFSSHVYIPVQSASPRGGWLDLSTLAEPLSLWWLGSVAW